MPRLAVAIALSLAVLSGCSDEPAASESVAQAAPKAPSAAGSGFDFYVLSLSWSPSYCEIEGENANRQQCASGRRFGFVVHGLWPQFERGYPEFCASSEPERVPDRLVRDNLDLMPSAGLIGHQWRKHGSCSGLSQRDYLATARAARGRISIPQGLSDGGSDLQPTAIEAAFIKSNSGLTREAMAVTCEGGLVSEVRICLTRDGLDFRACPEVDRGGCRKPADMPSPN